MNNNKSNNPFMGNNPMMNNLLKINRTKPMIKWIVITLFGILPFILLTFLVGPTDEINNWRNWNFVAEIDYGLMWAVGVVTIVFSLLVISLISFYTKDVKNDVIPFVGGFLFMGFGFYLFPLGKALSLLFILIAPIMFILGFAIAGFGVLIVVMRKISREMKEIQNDPNKMKEVQEAMEQFQKQNGGMFGNQKQNNSNLKKDKEEEYEDNPFVDVEPEEDEDTKK